MPSQWGPHGEVLVLATKHRVGESCGQEFFLCVVSVGRMARQSKQVLDWIGQFE